VVGGKVHADLEDYVGRAAYFVGDLDRKITWICRKLVRPGDTVLDIGANIGLVTLALAKFVGREGMVHCFEPNPSLCEQIRTTLAYNGVTQARLHEVALGDAEAMLELSIPPGNRGAASFVREQETEGAQKIRVPVRRLDQIAEEQGIQSLRLIKIDVEGYEAQVFAGADHVLGKIRPDAILFELNGTGAEPISEQPVIQLLSRYDYDFLMIPKSLLKMQLVRYRSDDQSSVQGHDFLAVRKGECFHEVCRSLGVSDS
jgi:FkbM family methyltransferase